MAKNFQVKAVDDVLFFEALDLDDAKAQLRAFCGDIPESLLSWSQIEQLPSGKFATPDLRLSADTQ